MKVNSRKDSKENERKEILNEKKLLTILMKYIWKCSKIQSNTAQDLKGTSGKQDKKDTNSEHKNLLP
jgi:hypothetical protein